MQQSIMKDGVITYVDYGVQFYYDSESDANLPKYYLTYLPQFSKSSGSFMVELKYPVCQSNTTMCSTKWSSDWDKDSAMSYASAISMIMIGLTSAVAAI